jgi:hypothetical protein
MKARQMPSGELKAQQQINHTHRQQLADDAEPAQPDGRLQAQPATGRFVPGSFTPPQHRTMVSFVRRPEPMPGVALASAALLPQIGQGYQPYRQVPRADL